MCLFRDSCKKAGQEIKNIFYRTFFWEKNESYRQLATQFESLVLEINRRKNDVATKSACSGTHAKKYNAKNMNNTCFPLSRRRHVMASVENDAWYESQVHLFQWWPAASDRAFPRYDMHDANLRGAGIRENGRNRSETHANSSSWPAFFVADKFVSTTPERSSGSSMSRAGSHTARHNERVIVKNSPTFVAGASFWCPLSAGRELDLAARNRHDPTSGTTNISGQPLKMIF